jgi:cobalt-zinc-cadmium efflux system outer membrane protein
LVEVYQAGVLDDARSSLSIIETAYQRGGATILDLLDAARTSAAVQLNYVDALGAYQRNLFQLESAVGRELTAATN